MHAADVLARAFQGDPMFAYLEPDGLRRARRLPWFFGAALRLGRQQGRVVIDEDRGAAIWLPPGRTAIGLPAVVRSGLVAAPLRLGLGASQRFAELTAAFEEAGQGVHGDSYWHLFILGVEPRSQGLGIGSRLVAPVLAEADTTRRPCYLETLAESNLGFYRRHGFEVAEHLRPEGLPEFWTMLRAPR